MNEWVLSGSAEFAWITGGGALLAVLVGIQRLRAAQTLLATLVAGLIWLLLNEPQAPGQATSSARLSAGLESGAGGYQIGSQSDGGFRVRDLSTLVRREGPLSRLQVDGHGLPAAAWHQYPQLVVDFRPGPLPAGLILDHRHEALEPGQPLTLNGTVIGSGRGWSVQLIGPGGVVIAEAPVEDERFELALVPRLQGEMVYRLLALDSRQDVIHAEPLPLRISPAPSLRVRMLLARPSFESAALRRWMERSGTRIQVVTELSQGVVRRDAVGAEAMTPGAEWDGLGALDLLVLDAVTLAELDPIQGDAVLDAVDQGLGMLVLGGEELLDSTDRLAGFRIGDRGDSQEVELSDGVQLTRAGLGIGSNPAGHVIQAANGEPLISVVTRGEGAVALSIVLDSHAWVSSGQPDRFAGLWSEVFRRIARPPAISGWLETATQWPRVGERVRVCTNGSDGSITCEEHYPDQSGWFSPTEGVAPQFIFEPHQWAAQRAAENRRDTTIASARSRPAAERTVLQPVLDPQILFLILLGLLGALWLSQKLWPVADRRAKLN